MRHQLIERLGAEVALRHPGDGLDVAQAAGTGLDVGLEVVGGVVGLEVPLGCSRTLASKNSLHRPDALGRERGAHGCQQRGLAGEQPRLEQRRHDARRRRRSPRAHSRHGAHAVADLEPDVPQERHQPLDRGALRVIRRLAAPAAGCRCRSRGAAPRARSRRRPPAPTSPSAHRSAARQAARSTVSMSAARARTSSSTGSSARKRALQLLVRLRPAARASGPRPRRRRRAGPASPASSGHEVTAGAARNVSSDGPVPALMIG